MIQKLQIHICVTLFSLLLLASSTLAIGLRDIGEDCEIMKVYGQDESKKCDSRRGLYCSESLRECRCYVPGTYYQMGTCRSKIRRACGLTEEGYLLKCVKHGFCNATINLCECERGYQPNEEHTACFINKSASTASSPMILGIMAIMAMILRMNCINQAQRVS